MNTSSKIKILRSYGQLNTGTRSDAMSVHTRQYDEVVRMIKMTEEEKLRIIESYCESCDYDGTNSEYRRLYADMWCEVEQGVYIK